MGMLVEEANITRLSSTLLTPGQAVYKGVRSWSKRTLERAGERVMDVPLPDDEDDDAAMPQPQTSDPDHPKTD
jgi:hypothetical protein